MAENDLTVTIGVDTSQLDAGLAHVKQAAAAVGGAAAAGAGGAATGPGGAPGGAGGVGGPGAAAAAAAAAAGAATQAAGAAAAAAAPGMQQAAGAAQNLAQAQNNVATASNNAGNAFERMLNRMMMRMGILYVIHEAIKLITEALQESSAYEAATVRWESLTRGAEGYGASLEDIKRISAETGISRQDLMGVEGEWKKIGVSTDVAGASLENLAKYAKILGVDIGTVAEEFGRVEVKRGSIKDMQDLAYATHDINLQRLVNDLAEAQRLAPILAEQQAQIDRQINRAADDRDRGVNRAMEDTDRLRNAQVGVAQAIGLAGRAYQEFIGGGRAGGQAGQMTDRLKSEMAVGAAQLAREGEPSVQQMRQMGVSGREIYQVLMAAAQRYHEQVRINLQRQEEDQKRLRERQQEDARENTRLKAAHDLLAAEDRVAQAIEKGIGANTAFGKAMETAEGLSGLIQEHMKEIVDDATIVSTGIQTWNKLILDFIDHLKEAGKWIENTPLAKTAGWLGGQSVKEQYEKEHGPGSYEALIHPSKPQWGLVPGNLSMSGLTPQQFMAGSGATPRDIADKLAQKQDEANQHQADTKDILRDIYNTLQMAFGA